MHESEHTVLANRFAAKENWSRASSEWNRVKARAGDLPMVVLQCASSGFGRSECAYTLAT
jgi:phosphopantetheinyl transferase (holo-ACP synthase)